MLSLDHCLLYCVIQGFAKLRGEFKPLLEGCINNRQHWVTLAEDQNQHDGGEECAKDNINQDKDPLEVEAKPTR